EGDSKRDRLLALAQLFAAVDVEDADLSELRSGRLPRGVDELARRDLLGDREREVLADGGIGDHVLVDEAVGNTFEEIPEIELERAPGSFEPGRMELADEAGLGAGRLARMKEPVLAALEARFELERCVEGLDDAFDARVPTLDDPRDSPVLRRPRVRWRQIHPSDLEQRDFLVTGIEVAVDRSRKAWQQRRPQHRLVGGERLGQAERVRIGIVRDEARG